MSTVYAPHLWAWMVLVFWRREERGKRGFRVFKGFKGFRVIRVFRGCLFMQWYICVSLPTDNTNKYGLADKYGLAGTNKHTDKYRLIPTNGNN